MITRCKSCFKEYDKGFGICPYCGYEDGEMPMDVFCLTPGTVIRDRYVIGQMLGVGGFGIIYKAWDKKMEAICAIKEYYPSGLVNRLPSETEVILVASKREREFVYGKARFLEEARNMAKFSTHKNIVNVFDFFEANNTAYIVMEFLDGKTMAQALQQQNIPFSYDYCIRIASEVCEALRAIHKENILHRDISPDNIMLCNDGTIKLFDFGAARFSAGIDSRVTVIVKPGFAPPEQYDRVNRQTPRTDIYALGATLYYALTGEKPEESTNRKIADTLLEPTQIDKSIPQQISTAVMRAMAVEPQYRFSDVDEFEKALLSEKPVVSVGGEKSKKNLRRFLGIAASILIIAGAALAFAHNWNVQKIESTLPNADLTMYFSLSEDGTMNAAKEAALQSILDSFTAEYSNVTIQLEGISADSYTDTIKSSRQDDIDFIFESTVLNEDALTLATDVPMASEASYREEDLEHSKQFPVGIIAPVIYVNTSLGTLDSADTLENIISGCQVAGGYLVVERSAIGMYSALYGAEIADFYIDSAKEDFLDGDVLVYLGKSSDYSEIQVALAGEYSIMIPGGSSSTYEYGTLWSISEMSDDSTRVAEAILEYLNTPLGQDYLHIQTQSSELPILTSTLQEYLEIYDEFSGLTDYLKKPFVAPETNIERPLTNADFSSLNDLIRNLYTSKFEDVAEDSWYAEAIANVCAKGYMEGKTEHEFRPDDPVTRAELVTALYRVIGSPEVDSQHPFSDVDLQSELGQAVTWAYEAGVVSQSSDERFNGDGELNLESTLVMLYRAAPDLGLEQNFTSTVVQYADGNEISSWAVNAVMWGIDHDVVSIKLGDSIFPKSAVSRGRFAVLLVRFLSITGDSSGDEMRDSYAETAIIPQTIINNDLQAAEEYLPKISFFDDGHCELVLNMAEWMQTIPASYEVFEYSDGSRVIKCVLSTSDLNDGMERNLTEFILVETLDNSWTFYGQLMGLTASGATYTAANDSILELKSEIIAPYSPIVGVYEYQNDDFDYLSVIENDNSGKIIFDVEWYRINGMENVEATVYGNYAVFFYSENGYYDTYGYLEFKDEKTIELVLTETRLLYLDPNAYQYTYVS